LGVDRNGNDKRIMGHVGQWAGGRLPQVRAEGEDLFANQDTRQIFQPHGWLKILTNMAGKRPHS